MQTFVRNSQFLSPFTAACGKHSSPVFGSHTATETMLVSSLSNRRLKRSLTHDRCFTLCTILGLQRYVFFLSAKIFFAFPAKKIKACGWDRIFYTGIRPSFKIIHKKTEVLPVLCVILQPQCTFCNASSQRT